MSKKKKKENQERQKSRYNKKKKFTKKITPIRWRKFEKFLFHVGCEFVEQARSSHRKYRKKGLLRPIIIPVHTKDIQPFLIQSNLKTLGITREQYLEIIADI